MPGTAFAQTFTATLSNVNFGGSFASGSFDFTSSGVISNSKVVLTYPALNYVAALADNTDSHVSFQNGFVVIELLNQHPTADCYLVSACGTSNVLLVLPTLPTSPGIYPLNCALCSPATGTYDASSDFIIAPPNFVGYAITSPGTLTVSGASTVTLTSAAVGNPYDSGQLTLPGGSAATNWSLFSGNLPSEFGVLPTGKIVQPRPVQSAPGKYEFLLSATDSNNTTVLQSYKLVILGAVTILDPVTAPVTGAFIRLLNGVSLTANRTALAIGGRKVIGVAADGISQVFFRIPTLGPNDQVTATLLTDQCSDLTDRSTCARSVSSDNDGGFFTIGLSVSPTQTLPASISDTNDGSTPDAFIAYRAPIDFARPLVAADAGLASRPVYVQLTYSSSGTPYGTQIVPLTIVRPLVVLIHGFNTDSTSWNGFAPLVNHTSRFAIFNANYGMLLYFQNTLGFYVPATNINITATNPPIILSIIYQSARRSHLGFSFNSPFVADDIKHRLGSFVLGNNPIGGPVAGIRIDIVAHSMGGLIARDLTAATDFLNSDNYNQGYIHKLITLGTPHFGTPQAILSVLPQTHCSRYWASVAGSLFFSSASLAPNGIVTGAPVPGAAGELSGDGIGVNLSPALQTIKAAAARLRNRGIVIPMSTIAGDIESIKSNVTTAPAAIFPNEVCQGDPLAERYLGTLFDSVFDPQITSVNPNGGPGGRTNPQNGRENDGSVPLTSALMNPSITTMPLCPTGQCFGGYTHSTGIAAFFALPNLPFGGGIAFLQDSSLVVSERVEALLNTPVNNPAFGGQ